jgi:catalase
LPDAPLAAAPVQDFETSPALRIIGKMKNTLEGRVIGILIADGSDGAVISEVREAAANAGAKVKIVALKIGGARLADGSILKADGQLAGTPSIMFDAIAVILSEEGVKLLARESAAIDFLHDAFAHLKAIAFDKVGQKLLLRANIKNDQGVVALSDMTGFISAAKTRQWDREASVRILA